MAKQSSSKSQISKAGLVNLTPKIQFAPGGGGDYYSEEISFDSHGNLWVAAAFSSSVVEYPKDQLTKRSPVPALTLPAGDPHRGGLRFFRQRVGSRLHCQHNIGVHQGAASLFVAPAPYEAHNRSPRAHGRCVRTVGGTG